MALANPNRHAFDIRSSLGYLLTHVRQEWIDAIEKELKPFDLSAAQYIVILNVGSGRAQTPIALCRTLQYDTGAMTRLIDRVEAKGLIKRVAHDADRRCVALEMTAAGSELYPKLVEIVKEMNRRATKGLTREEIDQLEALLRRVAANVALPDAPKRNAKAG
jgi:DNA-binding MarR family transcriptional regulator